MNTYLEEFEYIKNQLTYIKSKVDVDNQLGLYDINKLSEDIFMYILNDVYGLNLKNANLIQENFPAIDLVDDINKVVIQVTSTTTTTKLRETIKKFNELSDYADYQLQIFYIKDKPKFQQESLTEFASSGVSENDMLGIDDILEKVQANQDICKTLYKTIQQRMDNISFSFNMDSYFDNFETQIESHTTNKFKEYEPIFKDFIQLDNQVFEIHAVGGSGKSHLLKYLSAIETEYIPLIFTKQVNIEEDLKKLSDEKKYLFIFDDIDRFLDTPILINLLSYTLNNKNIKLIFSYRTASKSVIQTIMRKYNHIKIQELEIIWNSEDMKELIKLLVPDIAEARILKLLYTFNNNPYLVTQAVQGNIDTIKEFSKKIIDDSESGLKEFNLSNNDINNLLFQLALITPISENDIQKYFNSDVLKIINKLEDLKILRKLASKYRFNPDIQGDLFLAYYIDDNQESFEVKVEEILPIFSETIFTNLSYALAYNKSDSLQNFIKKVIIKWESENIYRNDYLALVNKIVYYAPLESFLYLQKVTKHLSPKENKHIKSVFDSAITKTTNHGDFNEDINAINLGSIEPIIAKLIDILKNNIECDGLEIKHIIQYLTSSEVLRLPKPHYDNQTLNSIFTKLVSPLDTSNFNTILTSLDIMENWIHEEPINQQKISIFKDVIQTLLNSTFENNHWDGFTYYLGQIPLNIKHPEVLKIINKVKEILLLMLDSKNNQILYDAIDSIQSIGGRDIDSLTQETQVFYSDIKTIFLNKIIELLEQEQELFIISRIETLAVNIINFSDEKEAALSILKAIDRNSEYILYQMVVGVDFLIMDYDNFYAEYIKQDNIKDWMFDSVYRMDKDDLNSEEIKVIEALNEKYIKAQPLISLLNKLNMNNWNSYSTLLRILEYWLEINDTVISDICLNYLSELENEVTKSVLKELSLDNGIIKIKAEDINEKIQNEELKVYISSIFKNYTSDKLVVLHKIIELIAVKTSSEIRMFIAIISQRIYFKLSTDTDLYEDFEPLIIRFLDWQLQYNFKVESYITSHSLKLIKTKYGISKDVRQRLMLIIQKEDIQINEFDLKSIYKILDLSLKDLLEILFNKLISKKADGYYRYMFSQYFNSKGLSESLLIKEYINSYEDFIILIDKTLDYYNGFTELVKDKNGNNRAIKIHLDYFLKYSIKQEYIEPFFSELIENKDIEKIKILYSIVPISDTYFNIIVQLINILDGQIDDNILMHYLTQVGKIKSYSGSPLSNSPQLLDEESLFEKIYASIDSLSLKLKIKNELKYIHIQKRQEIERDIEHLLDK